MLAFSEMDKHVSIYDQLKEGGGSVILINLFTVEPEEADQLVAAWADDAAYMKRQPGFISTDCIVASSAVAHSRYRNYRAFPLVGLLRE